MFSINFSGYLISEVTIAEIDVPAPSSSGDMEILTRVVEATTRGGNSGIVELSPSIESVSAPQSSVSSKHSSAILSNVQTSSNPEDSSTLKSSSVRYLCSPVCIQPLPIFSSRERLPVEEKKRPEKLPAAAKFGSELSTQFVLAFIVVV